MAVVVETTIGDFTVDLFIEERPQTCKNFLKLCKLKYYNLSLFHTVQANFVAQTGDPTGSGSGGESVFGIVYGPESRYYEAEKMPKIKHLKPGLLSMVNCGNNMLGSQFLITLGSELQSLDEHCVFGEVAEGHDVLVKLNEAITDFSHRPYQDIRITHTVILQDPFDDLPGMQVPSMSPDVSQLPSNGMLAADEAIGEDEDLTTAELEEIHASKEAQARATILEIIGDLPHADVAPPENVLFVCKLNPVTTDQDLETIFSRFGKVNSCEVIRDHVTGESLQYAFVEFAERRSCEQAFAKMDNVLIDDRRIHVDFSQSVSKVRWKGKGRGVELVQQPVGSEDGSRGSHDGRFGRRDLMRDVKRDIRRLDDRRRRRENDREEKRFRRNERRVDGKRKDDGKWRDERKNTRDQRKNEFSRRREEFKRRRGDDYNQQRREGYNPRWGDERHGPERHRVEEEQTHFHQVHETEEYPTSGRPTRLNGSGNENGKEKEARCSTSPNCPEPSAVVPQTHTEKMEVEEEQSSSFLRQKKVAKLKSRRPRDSSSSSSSSSSCVSSSSSSSSTSSSSTSSSDHSYRRGKKRLLTKTEYYDRKGKLVKVVKTHHDSSSSEFDYKHKKKRKNKKKVYTKKIKVIKKDSDNNDSDSDEPKVKSKASKKKKKKEKSKKEKRRKASDKSSSDESEETEKKKSKYVAAKGDATTVVKL